MTRDWGIPSQTAREISEAYLRRLRRNVENPRMSLDAWRLFLWVNALGEEYEEFADEIYEKWKKLRFRNLAPSESTLSLLRALRKEYQLALISNGPSHAQWEKIRELNLEDYFDSIVISGDLGCEKPDPKIFQSVCSSLGVEPFECLILGDKLEADIKGGLQAGIGITVWLPREGEKAASEDYPPHPSPDFIIRDVTELLTILGKPKKNERSKSGAKLLKAGKGASSSAVGGSVSGSQATSNCPSLQLPSSKLPLPDDV